MSNDDKNFIAQVYSLVVQIEDLIKKEGYEDRVMSAMVVGIIDIEDDMSSEADVQLKSIFSYNLDSKLELDVIKEIMDQQFEDPDDDIDSLLGDLGISLN